MEYWVGLGGDAYMLKAALYMYRRLQNVCNRKVKSEKATAFLIWMILLFSVVRLTTISEHDFASPWHTFCNLL